jgi:hypothetical protein
MCDAKVVCGHKPDCPYYIGSSFRLHSKYLISVTHHAGPEIILALSLGNYQNYNLHMVRLAVKRVPLNGFGYVIITSRCREPIVTWMRIYYDAHGWASNNRH